MAERQDRGEDGDGERELWLGELLDAAAGEYQPDAERLKALVTARIARQSEEHDATAAGDAGRSGSGATGRPTRRGLRVLGRLGVAGMPAGVALATIGVAAAIAVGAAATIAVTSSNDDHHTVTVAAPSSSAGTGGSSSRSAAPSEEASSAATVQVTRPAAPNTGATAPTTSTAPASPGLVTIAPSIGQASNPNWSELDLAVTVKKPLTVLHVTVTVAKCDGLTSTGSWTTGASGEFTEQTTTDSGGSITYQLELAAGKQATTGMLTFAVQFNHAATGWKPQDDTFYLSARTAASTSASSASGAY